MTEASSNQLNTLPGLMVPRHIAVIMDGNGRWAVARGKKRVYGHKEGMNRAREIIQVCGELGIEVLTLFAFSSENWNRPQDEVGFLMNLFISGLTRESKNLNKNQVRLKVIGDVSRFDSKLQKAIANAEQLTQDNQGLILQIAANYGGQWDIVNAVNRALASKDSTTSESLVVTIEDIQNNISGGFYPMPDLLIRTGGELRISNFLLWQSAYSELYFSELLWPDFDRHALLEAIEDFSGRQRRFGKTGQQIEDESRLC